MGRLFGTDGARGVANKELTCEIAYKIGKATAMVLAEGAQGRPQILIGKDTRISSDMLEAALSAGLCSVGADVLILGVVPTPAVAYLVKELGCNAGIMISASHNPAEYNGIKLFNHEGYKLPDSVEEEIEAIVLDNAKQPPEIIGEKVGTVKRVEYAVDDYIKHIVASIDGNLSGMKIALDCANGSASTTAKKLFTALGADCIIINAEPDGININKDCGSTHLEQLQKTVVDNDCELGLAFDGDADRGQVRLIVAGGVRPFGSGLISSSGGIGDALRISAGAGHALYGPTPQTADSGLYHSTAGLLRAFHRGKSLGGACLCDAVAVIGSTPVPP